MSTDILIQLFFSRDILARSLSFLYFQLSNDGSLYID